MDTVLRIVKASTPGSPSDVPSGWFRSSSGSGGHRLDASPNFWKASGLKVDSAFTDIVWGYGSESTILLLQHLDIDSIKVNRINLSRLVEMASCMCGTSQGALANLVGPSL